MPKPFTSLAALLFLAAAAVHAYRLFVRPFVIQVAGHTVPLWASWPVGGAALILAVMLYVEMRRRDLRL